MPHHSRSDRGPASIPLRAGVIVAACGPTVPPIPTSAPTPTVPPATADAEPGRVRPDRLPASDDAPCGQAKAPDPTHGAYTRRTSSGSRPRTPTTVVFELCRPGRRVPGEDRGAGLRDQRHGLAARAHPTPGSRDAGDRQRGQRDRPYRLEDWDPRLGDQPRPQRRATGAPAPRTSGSSCAGARTSRPGVTELQNGTVDGIDGIDAGRGRGGRRATSASRSRAARRAATSSTSGSTPPTSRSTTRVSGGRSRSASTGRIDRHDDFPPGAEVATSSTRRARSRTAAPAAPGTTTTRPWPRRRWPPPASPTGSRRRSTTARRRPPSLPDPGRRRDRDPVRAPDQPRDPGDARGRARRRLSRGRRRRHARRPPPARPRRRPTPTRRPSSTRASRRARRPEFGPPFARHRQGAGGRPGVSPIGAKREAAYAKVNDLIRSPRPDDPDRAGRRRRPRIGSTSRAPSRRRSASNSSRR